MPITPMKFLGGAGLTALVGGGIALTGANALFDILKTRYNALNRPTWDAQGQAKLFGENADTYSFVKGREMLYKGMYEIPFNVVNKEAAEFVDDAEALGSKLMTDYKLNQNFQRLTSSPEVQALGQAKARMLYDQMASLAPNVIRKAPTTALSAMQSAIAADSLALRPELIYNLARAESSL